MAFRCGLILWYSIYWGYVIEYWMKGLSVNNLWRNETERGHYNFTTTTPTKSLYQLHFMATVDCIHCVAQLIPIIVLPSVFPLHYWEKNATTTATTIDKTKQLHHHPPPNPMLLFRTCTTIANMFWHTFSIACWPEPGLLSSLCAWPRIMCLNQDCVLNPGRPEFL